jgi:hypothetical protein
MLLHICIYICTLTSQSPSHVFVHKVQGGRLCASGDKIFASAHFNPALQPSLFIQVFVLRDKSATCTLYVRNVLARSVLTINAMPVKTNTVESSRFADPSR